MKQLVIHTIDRLPEFGAIGLNWRLPCQNGEMVDWPRFARFQNDVQTQTAIAELRKTHGEFEVLDVRESVSVEL